jgi:hypothetical protein
MLLQYKAMLLIGLFTVSGFIHAEDEPVVSEFVTALNACDRGLNMPLPKSQGSLDILQMSFQKYLMNSHSALEKNPSLKNFSNIYNGEYFKSVPFSEVYHRCETQLAEKVKRAEMEVTQRTEARQRKFAEQQPLVEKLLVQIQQAESHALNAIDKGCAHAQLTAENAVLLFPKYTEEKQQALQLYPDIGLRKLNVAKYADVKSKNFKKIDHWFQECDALFARLLPPPVIAPPPISQPISQTPPQIEINTFNQLPYLAEFLPAAAIPAIEIVPTPQPRAYFPIAKIETPHTLAMTSLSLPPPPVVEPVVEPVVTPIESPKEPEKPVVETDKTYQELLAKMQGDRLKILQTEKRLPDTIDGREQDYQKATRWQYQKVSASGKDKCVIYSFAHNRLTRTKEFSGQCP